MAQVLTKPVDPYQATRTTIVVLILRIVLIHIDVSIVPVGIERNRMPIMMKFIRYGV